MNTLWSDFVQTPEELYASRELRFRADNKDTWLPVFNLRTGDDVLEIGCAGGLLLHRLLQYGPGIHATGLDRDARHIEFAKEKTSALNLNCEFVKGDALALPFADDRFDLAFSHTVIEHVQTQPFLREQYRVLKPGGRILVLSVRTSLNVSPENWKPKSGREKDLLDKAWQDAQPVIDTLSLAKYALNESAFPLEIEKAGFINADVQFFSLLSYAPDNDSVPDELALRQIEENRLAELESMKKALRIHPDALSAAERQELEELIRLRHDARAEKYRRGEKIHDIATSTVLAAIGVKPD